MKQLSVDLVILNERAASYVQDLQIAIEALVRTNQSRLSLVAERSGGRVFVLRSDLMSSETRALLISIARVVLVGQRGRLSDQLDRVLDSRMAPVALHPRRIAPPTVSYTHLTLP